MSPLVKVAGGPRNESGRSLLAGGTLERQRRRQSADSEINGAAVDIKFSLDRKLV